MLHADRPPRGVVARFADAEGARAAIDALERAGVEAASISVEGPAAERAQAPGGDVRAREAAMTGAVGRRVLLGGGLGAVAGALIGFLIAVVWRGGDLGMVASSVGVVAGAVMGGGVGGVAAGMSALRATEGWELTFEPRARGEVVVRVDAEREEDVARGEEILRELRPLEVRRTGG
ncbi:MAG TPA: hypothetical protein VNO17_02680, partial [Actinomycetota bacterium]|nr:hypothetical protein [Actinomycetota bacterium]